MPRNLSTSSSTFPPPPAARHRHSGLAGTSTLSIWLSVDPMSDKYPGVSPYTYCANNPVRLVDKDGRTFFEVEGERKHIKDGHDNITMLNVTEKQFNRLQRNFDKGHTRKYNTLHNRFKNHNGYIENKTCGDGFMNENGVYVLPETRCIRHTGEPYFREKVGAFIRKIDEGGSGDYFDRKCAEAVEPYAMGAATINPLVGFPNAVKIVTTREDIYGISAGETDIGMSWISIGLTAAESAMPELELINLIYGVSSGVVSGIHYSMKKHEKK